MTNRLTTLFATAVLVAGLALPVTSRAQGVGLSAGANFTELGDIETADRSATLDNVTGWHVHLWFDLPVGPVAVRPGIRYMDAGRLFDPEDASGFGASFSDEQHVTYLEIPLDVRFRLGLPLVTPYVLAGPVLRFATDTNNEDRLQEFSLAGGAGIGAEIGLVGIRLYPELKYTFGITRFTKDEYQFGGIEVSPDEDQKLNAVMLSLGIGL